MKKFIHLFAFDNILVIVLVLLFVLYTKSLLVLVIGAIYLFYKSQYKTILMLFVIISLILIRIAFLSYDSHFYYIKSIYDNKYIISNGLNDAILYTNNKYNINNLIHMEDNGERLKDIDKLKKNQIYEFKTNNTKCISEIKTFRTFLYRKYISLDDTKAKMLIGKLLFNDIDYENGDDIILNLGFSHYFLFKYLLDILYKTKINKKYSIYLVSILFIQIFGFNYIIIRIITLELFNILFKEKDKSLALSMLIMILYNPYSIYSYSFIIPYIIRINFLFNSKINFKSFLMIIQSYFFNQIELATIILYKPLMMFNILALIFSILSLIYYPIINILNLILSILSITEPLYLITIKGKISIIFIILYLYIINHYKIQNKILQNILIILIIASNISNIYAGISFIDVGQGDAILIKNAFNNEVILIDTGTKYQYYKLKRELNRFGIYEIDYLIITHSDKDHSGAIKPLFKDFIIKNVVTEHKDVQINNIYLKSLNDNKYNNVNDNSLVYYLKYDGYNFLFTGDISKYVEENIVNNYPFLKIDVLKLSHHGSKSGTSNRLLNSYGVKIGIVSTSGMYDHPSSEVVNRLQKFDIKLLSTKDKGTITFNFLKLFDFISCNNHEFVIIK